MITSFLFREHGRLKKKRPPQLKCIILINVLGTAEVILITKRRVLSNFGIVTFSGPQDMTQSVAMTAFLFYN